MKEYTSEMGAPWCRFRCSQG